jgi:hypothetical protein
MVVIKMNDEGLFQVYFRYKEDIDCHQYMAIGRWCEGNFGQSSRLGFYYHLARWYSRPEPEGYTFIFGYIDDFVCFKLTWCCNAAS